MNLDNLLEKAKWDKISEDELNYVVDLIEKRDEENLYIALFIIGRAWARQYRKLVESFLDYKEDTMVARMALNIFCNYWDFMPEYMDWVKKFLKGVEWDKEDDDVRLIAISSAGRYLETEEEPELLALLLKIFEDESDD